MKKNVLVVDDSGTMRKLVIFALKRLPEYTCVEAENGSDALNKIKSQDFDLVITDLNMPVMDGIEFIRNARKEEKYVNTPIIMLTTESGEEDKKQGFEAGATEYLVKPFQPPALLELVKRFEA